MGKDRDTYKLKQPNNEPQEDSIVKRRATHRLRKPDEDSGLQEECTVNGRNTHSLRKSNEDNEPQYCTVKGGILTN